MVQNVNFVEDTRSATTPGFSQGAVQGSGRNTSSSWAQSTQSRGTQSSGEFYKFFVRGKQVMGVLLIVH